MTQSKSTLRFVSTVGGNRRRSVGDIVENIVFPSLRPEVRISLEAIGAEARDGLFGVVILTPLLGLTNGGGFDTGVSTDRHHGLTELTVGVKSGTAEVVDNTETLAVFIIRVTALIRAEVDVKEDTQKVLTELTGDIGVLVIRVSILVEVTGVDFRDGNVGANEGAEVPLVVSDVGGLEGDPVVVPGGPGGTGSGGDHTDKAPGSGTATLRDIKVVTDELVPSILSDLEGRVEVQVLDHLTLSVVVVNVVLEKVDDTGLATQKIVLINVSTGEDEVVDFSTTSVIPEGFGTISPPEELVLVGRLEGEPVTTKVPVTIGAALRVAEGTVAQTGAVVFSLINLAFLISGIGESHKGGQKKCSDHVL